MKLLHRRFVTQLYKLPLTVLCRMTNGTIVTSIPDAVAVISQILESAENEVVWLVPRPSLVYALKYSIIENSKVLTQRGVRIRGIVDFSYSYIDIIQQLLDAGQHVRYLDKYQGGFMVVADKKSISSMSIDVQNLSLDTPVVALWSDDPTYAEYLTSNFESAWEQSIPAAERIEELLRRGVAEYLSD